MARLLVALAMPLGLAAGGFVAFLVARYAVRFLATASGSPAYLRIGAIIGALVLALPGVFAAIVVGGNLGGAWAEQVLGETSIPLGLLIGIGVVSASTLSVGAVIGALLGRAAAALMRPKSREA